MGIGITPAPATKLHVNGGQVIIGSILQNYWTGSQNWNATLRLDGLDHTSINFQDAGHSVGDITYVGGVMYVMYIGRDIGWGPAMANFPGAINLGGASAPLFRPRVELVRGGWGTCAEGNITISGSCWYAHTCDDNSNCFNSWKAICQAEGGTAYDTGYWDLLCVMPNIFTGIYSR